MTTTLGRLIFNEILPERIGFQNKLMDRGALKDLTADLYRNLSNDETAWVLDEIKDLGFHYATSSGITIAINDIQVPDRKPEILTQATSMVDDYDEQFLSGLISEEERYSKTVDAWTWASDQTHQIGGGGAAQLRRHRGDGRFRGQRQHLPDQANGRNARPHEQPQGADH